MFANDDQTVQYVQKNVILILENIKVVWAKFSTLSQTVLLKKKIKACYAYNHFNSRKA